MAIKRVPGHPGRSRFVSYNGQCITVATADDKKLDMRGQTKQALEKIEKTLKENGSDKSKILHMLVYVSDLKLKKEMDEVFVAWVHPDGRPTRACVQAGLEPGTLIEIVCFAAA